MEQSHLTQSSGQPGLLQITGLIIARELRLAVRHWDQVAQPLIFFVVVTTLFPLAISPSLNELRNIAPGVVWVAAMLSSLLSLESLFRPDVEDGTIEQWALSGQPLPLLLLAKTVKHWLLAGPAAGNAGVDLRRPRSGPRNARRSGRGSAKLAGGAAAAVPGAVAICDERSDAHQYRIGIPRKRTMWLWFYKLASPPYAYAVAGKLRPWLLWSAAILMIVAAYGGLAMAPADYQQKDAFRIIYVHVPSATLSLSVYVVLAVSAAIGLIWRIKLAHAVAAACAPVGAWFTVLALATGSIWGKPMWGTWWTWDPRITSELIQLFLYLGYMALRSSFDDTQRADRASAILAIVGVVNVPVVKYSVIWWNSLHQGPTISLTGKSTITGSMLWPLLLMMLAFMLYFAGVLCDRVRSEILKRERNASWLGTLVPGT
jgi:heme exporter protein C